MSRRALILVDIQNDFLPGGALAVPDGDHVIPIANRLMDGFDIIVATQDWHPADHDSFAENHPGKQPHETIVLNGLPQILWPTHCVQGTRGAEFADALDIGRITKIFHKGTDPAIDSYSGFFDNGRMRSTGLAEWLHEQGITALTICGLATDYCVKHTALDALAEGFDVTLHLPACRGVNLNPTDARNAVSEMEQSGTHISK